LLFGAAAVLLVEERFARHLLTAWSMGRSSLICPGIDPSVRAHHGTRGSAVSPLILRPVHGRRSLRTASS
jgi:hypothetical protein